MGSRIAAGIGALVLALCGTGCGTPERDAQQQVRSAQIASEDAGRDAFAAQMAARMEEGKLSYKSLLAAPAQWDADTKATVDLYDAFAASLPAWDSVRSTTPGYALVKHLSDSRKEGKVPGAGPARASSLYTEQLVDLLRKGDGIADDRMYEATLGLLRAQQCRLEGRIIGMLESGAYGSAAENRLRNARRALQDTVYFPLDSLQDARLDRGLPVADIPATEDFERVIETETFRRPQRWDDPREPERRTRTRTLYTDRHGAEIVVRGWGPAPGGDFYSSNVYSEHELRPSSFCAHGARLGGAR